MDCLTGKSDNLAEISASSALHVKPLCRNTIPRGWPKFGTEPCVICTPGVHIWPNNNSGRNFGQKNTKRRIDTPKSLAMRGRTHITVTNTASNKNQSKSMYEMCSASSKASKEATLSASQSISRSLSQESMAMEHQGQGPTLPEVGLGGHWGGSGSGLRAGFGGKAIPAAASGARLAARVDACAVRKTPCWAAVRAGAFVCNKSSTPSGTLVRATTFRIACNRTTFNQSVVIRVLDMVLGKDRSSIASSLLTSTG